MNKHRIQMFSLFNLEVLIVKPIASKLSTLCCGLLLRVFMYVLLSEMTLAMVAVAGSFG